MQKLVPAQVTSIHQQTPNKTAMIKCNAIRYGTPWIGCKRTGHILVLRVGQFHYCSLGLSQGWYVTWNSEICTWNGSVLSHFPHGGGTQKWCELQAQPEPSTPWAHPHPPAQHHKTEPRWTPLRASDHLSTPQWTLSQTLHQGYGCWLWNPMQALSLSSPALSRGTEPLLKWYQSQDKAGVPSCSCWTQCRACIACKHPRISRPYPWSAHNRITKSIQTKPRTTPTLLSNNTSRKS